MSVRFIDIHEAYSILKEKKVNLGLLDTCKSVDEYNKSSNKPLTSQEFNIMKNSIHSNEYKRVFEI